MEELKKRICQYWTILAETFAVQRLRELNSEKAVRWLTEIEKYLPEKENFHMMDACFRCLVVNTGVWKRIYAE